MPIGICTLDQGYIPVPAPVLQLLFTRNRPVHVAEQLVMHQPFYVVLRGEAGKHVVAMLGEPANEVARDADIERAQMLAGQDIDTRLAIILHEEIMLRFRPIARAASDADLAARAT